MRFFSHDGKTVHGPSSAAELSALPGFDGDTLVCPVGSEDSADWKPALAYPPFRELLLAPAPKAAPAPLPPPPPPPAPTAPCPRCSARNPDRARYCNECGARMDGTVEAPPPAPAPAPVPLPPPPTPAPMSRPPMGRPGGMMGRIEEAAPGLAPIPLPEPPSPVPLPAGPAPAPVPSSDAASLRKTLIAAFLGASLASGGLGYYLLRPRAKGPKVPAGTEITLTPPPAAPAPAPVAAPVAPAPVAPAPAPVSAPVAPEAARPAEPAAAPAPAAPAPRKAKAAPKPAPAAEEERPAPPPKRIARKPKRAKAKAAPVPVPKPEPSPAPAGDSGESLIESRVNALEGAAAEPKAAAAAEPKPAPLAPPSGGESPAAMPQIGQAPSAAPAAAPDGGLMLPGLPRRVGPKSVTKPKADAKAPPPSKPSEAPAPSVPDAAGAAAAAAPAGVASTPAAAPGQDATAAPEDPTLRQVREQFEFCGQLLAQGAYDDHFDTCLCAETRNGAPYRGRRGLYSSTLKKSAAAGKLETAAVITAIALDGASAKVTATWKTSSADRGRTASERWQLEDGLWCRAP